MFSFVICALELLHQVCPWIFGLHDVIEVDVVKLYGPGGCKYDCTAGKAIEVWPGGQEVEFGARHDVTVWEES